MTEREFAQMPIEELKAYCDELKKNLGTAQWSLRNYTIEENSSINIQELKENCNKILQEFNEAQWFLRNRMIAENKG